MLHARAGAAEAANDTVFHTLTNAMLEQHRRHPNVPIDERQLMRGLRRNDATSNIANWSARARAEDAAYYDGLPMYPEAADPVHTGGDIAGADEIDARLRASMQQVQAEDSAAASMQQQVQTENNAIVSQPRPPSPCPHPSDPPQACNAVERAIVSQGPVAAWCDIIHDLSQWDSLTPTNVPSRLGYVFMRKERAVWVAATLLAVAGMAAAARLIAMRVGTHSPPLMSLAPPPLRQLVWPPPLV
jgi:hypothetical protein